MNLYILLSCFQNPNKKTFYFCLLKKTPKSNKQRKLLKYHFCDGKGGNRIQQKRRNYTWSEERNRRQRPWGRPAVEGASGRGSPAQTAWARAAALSPSGEGADRSPALTQTPIPYSKSARASCCRPLGVLRAGRSQDVDVLHQVLLVVPGAPHGAEGALLAPPCHPDRSLCYIRGGEASKRCTFTPKDAGRGAAVRHLPEPR